MNIKKNFFAPLASGLGATRRAAVLLLVMMLTATTAWAWDGQGTEANPFEITCANDLVQLATDVNDGTDYKDKYFKQTANITLTSAWTPIGTESHPFKGHYDGGGFTISGLTVSGSYKYAGLFGYITSYYDAPSSHDRAAELKNINIVDCNIDVSSAGSGNGKAGGIAGYVNCFNMSNCKVSGTIKGYDYAAGLIGQAGSFCTMSDCFADVTVSAHKADPNAQNPPAYCLIGQYLNNMSASGNYYHNTAGITAGISSAIRLYAVTCLTDGLSMSQPTVSHGGKGYYTAGANVTISGPEGYQLAVSYNDGSTDHAVSPDNTGKYVITMSDKDITVSAVITVIPWSGNGTEGNPYLIEYASQLDLLAQRVNGDVHNNGNNYYGVYFKLGNDISYPHTSAWNDFTSDENNFVAIGSLVNVNIKNSDYRYFRGHFDGNNKTISGIRIYKNGNSSADMFQGIFGLTFNGADIHDLTLADTRITGQKYTGGIVGRNGGTVSRCHVTDDVAVCKVQSNGEDYGGIVGENKGGTLRDNLVIGATVPAATVNTYGAIVGSNTDGGTLQRNYYYACKVANVENATGVGCHKADVTVDDGAVSIHTLALAEGITTATATTTTIGTTGYYAQGTAITLSYSGSLAAGYQLAIVSNDGSISNAAVADGNGHYTAVMPAADATAKVIVVDWATAYQGDANDPYMIYNEEQLDLLAHRVNGGNYYNGKYFKLGNDINYPHTSAWNAFTSDESNYEAIGGKDRPFRGHFDGNNKTISGIRIYKGSNGDADKYQGIFGLTGNGADIHDLTLADTRITGFNYAGGIVGANEGGNVSRCHVTDDVAVCAVRSQVYNHGGIAGGNNGTIKNCTSAATLTIAGTSYYYYYGGIAGDNRSGGTLRDNLAIGATVPAATSNRYGAITGDSDGGTLQRNYYSACKVANVENATGVGSKNADVTADDGAVPGYFLTFGDGITSSALSITIPEHKELNGNSQLVTVAAVTYNVAAAGTTVSFNSAETEGYSPLYSVNGSPVSGNSITMPDADVTITATLQKLMTNNDITVTIPSQTWTGNELTPVITVKDGENVLTENTDYTVTPPSGPIQDSGNHAYTITGMGNYAGSREAMFTISPRLARQAGAVYIYQDQNGMTALLDGTSVDPVDIDFDHNIIVNHVTSNRVFTPGMASTVMLPFNYTCNGNEGGTFYKFVGVKKENDKWVATMQETGNDTNKQGTLEANTPYLFMPAATTMTFPNINGSVWLFTRGGGSGGNCETADPGSHWTFKGTYRYIEWTAGTTDPNFTQYAEEIGRAYGFAGVAKDGINVGDFVRVASGAKIRPIR